MKRTTVTGTYRFDEVELIQFSISIPTNYPDVVSEAKAQVVAAISETLTDVMDQTRPVIADSEEA